MTADTEQQRHAESCAGDAQNALVRSLLARRDTGVRPRLGELWLEFRYFALQ